MSSLNKKAEAQGAVSFMVLQIVLYRMFVDGTYCLFRSRSDIDKFLKHINKYHPNIQFIVEVERDDSLPFLYILFP